MNRIYNLIEKALWLILIILVILFTLYPILCVLINSIIYKGKLTSEFFCQLFDSNNKLLYNSLKVAFLTATFSTIIGMCLALKVFIQKGILQKIFMVLLLVSMVAPPFMAALTYIQLYGRRGLITYRILGLSNLKPYGIFGIVSMQTLFFSSQIGLILMGVLKNLDQNVIDAARDLGASSNYTLRKIIIPMMRPAIIVCFLISFIHSLSDFGTPMVIGGAFNTLATEIYMQIIAYSNFNLASAMNVLLLIPTVIAFIIYRILMKKNKKMLAGNGRSKKATKKFEVFGVTKILINSIGYVFFVIMSLEYISIIIGSFTRQKKGKLIFTTEYVQRFLDYDLNTIIRSVIYALIVALIGSFLAILFAYYVERRKMKLGGVVDFIATMPYMLPGTCFGIGYILAFNKAPFKLTGLFIIVIINMIFKQLPVTTKLCAAMMNSLDENIDEAGRDLGANRLVVLFRIILPNLKTAYIIGFINNFTSSMITVGSIIFLINPGQKLAVFTLFEAINSGELGIASLMSTVIILITVSINLVFTKLVNR